MGLGGRSQEMWPGLAAGDGFLAMDLGLGVELEMWLGLVDRSGGWGGGAWPALTIGWWAAGSCFPV